MVPGRLYYDIRFDEHGQAQADVPRPLRLVGGQELLLHLDFKELVVSSVPPAYQDMDVTAMAGTVMVKRDIDDDDDAALVNTALTTDSPPISRMRCVFDVPDTDADMAVCEVALANAGLEFVRVQFPVVIQRRGLI